MTKETQRVICIIGMHRSGTSMVTRLLSSCGLELGPSDEIYLDSLEDNPGGHFEHKNFHKINEALLSQFGGSWDNPPQFEDDWEYAPDLEEITRNAKDLVKTFKPYSHWGWKDPRTTLLLPFWKSLVSNLHFVICIRNPLEVAQSLARRDRIPIQSGVYLWNQYMQTAIRDTEGYPRIITFYEDFFNDTVNEVKRLVDFCGLPLPDDLSQVTAMVSAGLKHHAVDIFSLLNEDKLLNEHKLFYLGLRALISNKPTFGQPEDALISAGISKLLTLFEQAPDEQSALINNLQAQLQKQQHAARSWADQAAQLKSMAQDVESQRSQLITEREAMGQEIAELQGMVQAKDEEVQRRQQIAQETERYVTRLIGEQETMQQEITNLQQALQQKDNDVSQLKAERNNLQQKYQAHQATLSRREGELRDIEIARSDLQRQLDSIFNSRGYKPLVAYWQLADRLAPLGSKQRKTAEFLLRAPRLLTWQNMSSVLRQVRLYGLAATYRGASAKVKDGVSGQVNIIQTRPQIASSNGYFSMAQATISVVIPVKNAGPEFRQSLTLLTNQRGLADIELIIVDSGSTDQSPAIAEEFGATIIYMPPGEFSHAEARNIGAEQASGDYLLFTVQDAFPATDTWLASLLKTLQQKDVAAVSCAEKPKDDADLFYKAGVWQYNRFLEVDKYDRIMRQPERENHLTLRKNSALSNIACLISRNTFLQYKFRGEYAEDLDLGLRLIRDGHQLALLGSTRIIHSHNRPPYAHLKRGYVDELTLAEILPDRPVLETNPRHLFSDLIFVYDVVWSITDQTLKQVKTPCKPKGLATAVLEKFRSAIKGRYPGQVDLIDLNNNPYLSGPFKSFLQSVIDCYRHDGLIDAKYEGTLLERLKAYTMLIIDYLNHHYEVIDESTLEDFRYSLYKAYAFLSGTYLASCRKNGSEQTKATLEDFHQLLTANDLDLIRPARLPASPNGTYRHKQPPQVTLNPAEPPATQAQSDQHRARLIALYLPQFHPIPENNEWWGEGFTEWTNVTKAAPLFEGHYQPHLPTDLGFYDLRLPETRLAQANLAKQYGIEGFCYYHYWFKGRRLLEQPFNQVLASGQPDFPFCLAWANETWSRRWLGEEKSILIKQEYSAEDDLDHARWLVNVFADPRNIRVQNRPLYLIYRPTHMPDVQRTIDILRETCLKHGLPDPFLLGINAHAPDVDYRALGFDGTMNFEPWLGALPDVLDDSPNETKLARNLKFGVASKKLKIYDYAEARRKMLSYKKNHPTYPCIFVSWDNSPRRGENGIVMINSTPENFEAGLADMIASVQHKPFDDRLVFINAWNEWAEGNHLEPDQKYGLRYLEAVKYVNSIKEKQ